MAQPVFFLGGAHSDFARNLAREKKELGEVIREVTLGALENASLDITSIDGIHVGNAFGELFTGQAQMGALPASYMRELEGVPASRHEGACASGSLAILAATAEIEAGRSECVLVVGAEQERNVSGDEAARYLGAAAFVGHEAEDAGYMWPHMFSLITEAIRARNPRAASRAHLSAIAKKNFANGKRNPLAQTRSWNFNERSFDDDDEQNPVVTGLVRRQDCGQVTDGAAVIVLASKSFAEAHARRVGRPLTGIPHLLGWGHRVGPLSLEAKLQRSAESPYLVPHMRAAILDAYRRAEVDGPFELQGFETHDCFSVTEYLALDHLGLTPAGEAFKAIEEGVCEMGGRCPVNPSGGLIGLGHPVGATGVRMALDACRQVSGQAGATQVEGAKRFGTLNIGGSATTVVSFVWGTT